MPPKRTAWQSTHWEKATQGWKAWLGLSSCKAVTGQLTATYPRNRQRESCVIVWMKCAGVQLTDWPELYLSCPNLKKRTLASSPQGKSSSLSISCPKPGTLCLPASWVADLLSIPICLHSSLPIWKTWKSKFLPTKAASTPSQKGSRDSILSPWSSPRSLLLPVASLRATDQIKSQLAPLKMAHLSLSHHHHPSTHQVQLRVIQTEWHLRRKSVSFVISTVSEFSVLLAFKN